MLTSKTAGKKMYVREKVPKARKPFLAWATEREEGTKLEPLAILTRWCGETQRGKRGGRWRKYAEFLEKRKKKRPSAYSAKKQRARSHLDGGLRGRTTIQGGAATPTKERGARELEKEERAPVPKESGTGLPP